MLKMNLVMCNPNTFSRTPDPVRTAPRVRLAQRAPSMLRSAPMPLGSRMGRQTAVLGGRVRPKSAAYVHKQMQTPKHVKPPRRMVGGGGCGCGGR